MRDSSDRFLINVNIVVKELLANDILLTHQKGIREAKNLIMDKLGVKKRTAERYLKFAREEILRITNIKKEKALERAMADRHYIILAAKELGDYNLLLKAMQDRDKLLNLYVDEIRHTGLISVKEIDVSKLTDDQLKTLKQKIKNNENVEEYLKLLGVI